ncbi:transposase [Pseudomonas protegens]|uniref:Transposase n=1 Tax=Pseudomonas protegens TaxID=380021 RepID=A0A2T6GSR5_9PSED|nr:MULTISPECIES: transposase [Pseudomonas]PUA47191.1 transposase [Pseudomonas protegens]ULT67976.1 transposase [Pseudomonas sp. BC42]
MLQRFHGNRLRTARYSQTGQIYLLTAVTHCRERCFDDWRIGRLLVWQLRQAQRQGLAHSLAWVVMPDHLHWLLELGGCLLAALMRRIKSCSAREINAHLQRSGRLWQKGYHDRALRRDEDLRVVARYLIANPIRAGLVTRLHDYPLWDAVWLKDS